MNGKNTVYWFAVMIFQLSLALIAAINKMPLGIQLFLVLLSTFSIWRIFVHTK